MIGHLGVIPGCPIIYKTGGGSLFLLAWEPAFADTFALFEEFQYRPETRETENAEQHGNVDVFHEERVQTTGNS